MVRYIDSETGNYLPEQFGRCDREIKCSYHLNPFNGVNNRIEFTGNRNFYTSREEQLTSTSKQKVTFIPAYVLKETLSPGGYDHNVFIQNLFNSVPFPFELP
ncbi:MAG: hypothetical protein IPG12_03180 [Saprospiraceae bacterium]|nr:hypothetical protein [Saprospiraceae bacterium]